MNPDEDRLPDMDVEIPRQRFDFHNHDWKQQGYTLICSTCPDYNRHATNIPPGKMLTGRKGNWEIVPEGGLMNQ